MLFDVDNAWKDILKEAIDSPKFKVLQNKLKSEYESKDIFPPKSCIFRSLKLTDYMDVKVVILGQDPYFNYLEADGLAFSCKSTKMPPSLRNIFIELKSDLNIDRDNGDLTDWATQGVLLLNTVLTVESGKPNSHQKMGWDFITNYIIEKLNERNKPIAFILWGSHALSKAKLINTEKHMIIKAPHPSPLSSYRGFFGSKPFSKANDFLKIHNMDPIKW